MRHFSVLICTMLPWLPLAPLGAQDKPVSKILRIGDLTAPLSDEFWLGPLRLWEAPAPESDRGPHMLAGLSFQARSWPEDPPVAEPFLDPETIRYLLASTGKGAGAKGSISQEKGEWRFSGSQKGLARARALIQELRARVSAPITVEFALYREPEAASPGLTWLTLEEGEKAMSEFRRADRIGLILHERAQVRPGDQVYMGEHRSKAFLADYNVEIAEGSKSVDPVVRRVRGGNGVTVVFETSPDGQSLALHMEISMRSFLDKVDSIPVGTADIESMDRIRYASHQVMANLALPQDGAFVYVPGGASDGTPEAKLRALFIVRHKSVPPETQSGAVLLPYGMLTSRLSRNHAPELEENIRLPQLLTKQEILRGLLRSVRDEQNSTLQVPIMDGRHMILTGSREDLSSSIKHLENLYEARSKSYLVRLGREAWIGGAWKKQGADLALPLMAWHSAAFIHGSAMSYLAHFGIEIAKDTKIMDPSVGLLFQGTAAQISIVPVKDKLKVLLALEETRLDELRRVEMKGTNKGTLEAPALTRLVRSRDLLLTAGAKQVLGSGMDQEVEGKSVKTRLWIQVDPLGIGK